MSSAIVIAAGTNLTPAAISSREKMNPRTRLLLEARIVPTLLRQDPAALDRFVELAVRNALAIGSDAWFAKD